MFLFVAGCGGERPPADPAAESAPAAEPIDPQRALTDLNAAHPELAPSQQVGGAEGRSPFVGDRVIKLNAIVRRSLDVSREFDKAAPGIRAAVDAAAAGGDRATAEAGLKAISDFYDRAKSAFDDMAVAEAELKASGEYYDDAIFFGMQKFVADIETELREEKAALAAKLG
jgi:hypothetical protein